MKQLLRLALVATTSALVVSLASAQIPDTYHNLQVLPKNIQKEQLLEKMKGVSRALGVRCIFCHKGEEGQPLSTFDFASDTKGHKRVARAMMRMVADINGKYLKEISEHHRDAEQGEGREANHREDEPGEAHEGHHHEAAKVTCNTCHRGHNEPEK